MFLVDDDKAKIRKGQKQRRAGPDHQLRVAGRNADPGPATRGLGHPRMPFGGSRPEARLDPVEELDRERDFRQKDQGLPAASQRLGHGFEIDFGLAGAGHALQERRGIGIAGDAGAELRRRGFLRRRQGASSHSRIEHRIGWIPRRIFAQDHTLCLQALDDARRNSGRSGDLSRRHAEIAVFLEGPDHPRASIRDPVRREPREPQHRPGGGRIGERGDPRRKPQHLGQRRQRVIRCALQKSPQFLAQRRHVDDADNRTQLFRGKITRPRTPDAPQHPARTERHLDEIAG